MTIASTRKKIRHRLINIDLDISSLAGKIGVHRSKLYNALKQREGPKDIEVLEKALRYLFPKKTE